MTVLDQWTVGRADSPSQAGMYRLIESSGRLLMEVQESGEWYALPLDPVGKALATRLAEILRREAQ